MRTNGLNAVGQGDGSESIAIIEGATANAGDGIGQCDRGKGRAIREGTVANGGTAGYGYVRDPGDAGVCPERGCQDTVAVSVGVYGVNGKLVQGGASDEGAGSNLRHRGGKIQTLQIPTGVKGIVTNGGASAVRGELKLPIVKIKSPLMKIERV